MTGGKVSDEVIDAIAFIEMHRQETEKESGTGAACAQALPKLQELLDQLNAETTEPADVHAANLVAVNNDIARVKRFASGGGHGGGGNKHPRPGQKKPAPRQHGQGHAPGQGHGGPAVAAVAGPGPESGARTESGPGPAARPQQAARRWRWRRWWMPAVVPADRAARNNSGPVNRRLSGEAGAVRAGGSVSRGTRTAGRLFARRWWCVRFRWRRRLPCG